VDIRTGLYWHFKGEAGIDKIKIFAHSTLFDSTEQIIFSILFKYCNVPATFSLFVVKNGPDSWSGIGLKE